MMAHKHLHELLREDQEPFMLKKYISDRRCQLNKPTTLQLKKRKPIIDTSFSTKKSCFFSFNDSPDVKKSPFFNYSPAPGKSPMKTQNSVFLHIPARTAAMLLEAAMKIQKQSSNPNPKPKPKTQIRGAGFGLFGSILKRLGHRNVTRNREIGGRKSAGKVKKVPENAPETCSSCRWEEFEEMELATELERENGGFDCFERQFCSSPQSPFRFSLQRSSSSGPRTPEISSPSRRSIEEKEKHKPENTHEILVAKEEEEEEKEQNSPVSVLDPPFEDDDRVNEEEEEEDDDDYDCSYAIVQRAQQQLLHKLHRFEKLAQLDPVELEKRMSEEEENDDDEEENDREDEEAVSSPNNEGFIREVLTKSSPHFGKFEVDVKALVTDLINEEKREQYGEICDTEMAVKRVCTRLDSLKGTESNTIDMMVALDMKRDELDGWKNMANEILETATEIEIAIFGVLVEELSEEMVSFTEIEAETFKIFAYFK